LGIFNQTLDSWIRQAAKGKFTGAGIKPFSAEQMELTRFKGGTCKSQNVA
jgi:hypothetical protein